MSAREGPIYIGPSSSEMGIFERLRLIGVYLVSHGCIHIMQSSEVALEVSLGIIRARPHQFNVL